MQYEETTIEITITKQIQAFYVTNNVDIQGQAKSPQDFLKLVLKWYHLKKNSVYKNLLSSSTSSSSSSS